MAKAIRKADEKANHKWWSKESAQEKDLLDEIEKLMSKKRFMKMDRKIDSTRCISRSFSRNSSSDYFLSGYTALLLDLR